MRLERSENTRRNVVAGEIDRVTGILLPFIVRTLIIRVIGAEYLGLTGLFYSILQTLSLAEMGFGTALVFCMYRPIADNDQDTLCALMDAYRRIYFRIGLVVLSAGLMLLPFLPRLIRGPVPEDIRTVYVGTVAHRLLLSPDAQSNGVTESRILTEILSQIPAPQV